MDYLFYYWALLHYASDRIHVKMSRVVLCAGEKTSGSRHVLMENVLITRSLNRTQRNAGMTPAEILSARMNALTQSYGK